MALTAADKDKLKALKIDPDKLIEAITADAETEVELPEGKLLTDKELESRDKAIKSKGYNEGKVAGVEMFIDAQKQALGLEFEGKDGEKFVEALQAKVKTEAGAKPSEALAAKDREITQLKQNITKLETDLQTEQGNAKKLSLKSTLISGIPSGLPVDNDEFLFAMEKAGYSFEQSGNGVIVKKNGEPLTAGNSMEAVDYKTAMMTYAKDERKWVAGEPEVKTGRGGSSTPPGKTVFTKASEVEKAWVAEGKSLNSADYQAHLQAMSKDKGEEFWND